MEPVKCIWLPERHEAMILLDKFLNEITFTHHIVHGPSLRRLFDGVYYALQADGTCETGQVALLLSILAMTTFSWTAYDDHSLFATAEQANKQSILWTAATMDVLNHSTRTTSGSLEDVQAMMTISLVILNFEGTSSRYWSLIATSMAWALHLSLHRIDLPGPKGQSASALSGHVQTEIGRRVWWYLAAWDWLLSRFPGPRQGIYTVNPQHMMVKMPINIRDEDLTDDVPPVELPLSTPTSMSYAIQRIRLAEIARNHTDHLPVNSFLSDSERHRRVMDIDVKIEQLMDEVPSFFSIARDGLEAPAEDDPSRSPPAIIQRYVLNLMFYTHRCKLHIPYLAVQGTAPRNSVSRDICLQCARMVLAADRLLRTEDLPYTFSRLKFGGVLYCLFTASTVLLLDLCLNRTQGRDETRKAELVDAFQLLEEGRQHNPIATKLLDSLMSVVRQNQLSLPNLGPLRTGGSQPESDPPPSSISQMPAQGDPGVQTVAGSQPLPEAEISYFDELWQTFDGGWLADSVDFSTILSELGSYG